VELDGLLQTVSRHAAQALAGTLGHELGETKREGGTERRGDYWIGAYFVSGKKRNARFLGNFFAKSSSSLQLIG